MDVLPEEDCLSFTAEQVDATIESINHKLLTRQCFQDGETTFSRIGRNSMGKKLLPDNVVSAYNVIFSSVFGSAGIHPSPREVFTL